MPDPAIDELQKIRDLLREGRTTEADRQLDEAQRKIVEELERRKREMPPPTPRTLWELEQDFKLTLCEQLGNPPRLTAILVEIVGKSQKPE